MADTYIMRAYDPAGEVFVQWTSAQNDTGGADYVGPPAFGTLINVHVVKYTPDAGGGGGGADIPFEMPADYHALQFFTLEDSHWFDAEDDLSADPTSTEYPAGGYS